MIMLLKDLTNLLRPMTNKVRKKMRILFLQSSHQKVLKINMIDSNIFRQNIFV